MTILVDTSVWIDFFHGIDPYATQLENLIKRRESLAINIVIESEILMGIKLDQKCKEISNYLKPFQYFPNLSHQYWLQAVEIYRKSRNKGVTVRKTTDCLIAANAIIDDLTLFQKDRDFLNIQKTYKNLTLL